MAWHPRGRSLRGPEAASLPNATIAAVAVAVAAAAVEGEGRETTVALRPSDRSVALAMTPGDDAARFAGATRRLAALAD